MRNLILTLGLLFCVLNINAQNITTTKLDTIIDGVKHFMYKYDYYNDNNQIYQTIYSNNRTWVDSTSWIKLLYRQGLEASLTTIPGLRNLTLLQESRQLFNSTSNDIQNITSDGTDSLNFYDLILNPPEGPNFFNKIMDFETNTNGNESEVVNTNTNGIFIIDHGFTIKPDDYTLTLANNSTYSLTTEIVNDNFIRATVINTNTGNPVDSTFIVNWSATLSSAVWGMFVPSDTATYYMVNKAGLGKEIDSRNNGELIQNGRLIRFRVENGQSFQIRDISDTPKFNGWAFNFVRHASRYRLIDDKVQRPNGTFLTRKFFLWEEPLTGIKMIRYKISG